MEIITVACDARVDVAITMIHCIYITKVGKKIDLRDKHIAKTSKYSSTACKTTTKNADTLKTNNYPTLFQIKMFINVTDKRVRSKSFRGFSRNFFFLMRDTRNGYDANENTILLVKKINKLLRRLEKLFDIRGVWQTRNIYKQTLKKVFREI